ncbi:hypothetical protein [Xanthomonas hortorum]|uniref:hypothetical protein n=1 Tax=Xanthomonas hortorum TaxID=56454 RepID=UPI001F3E0A1D|nr:hypothetical protein [Xanthomonas hortorum]MCE4344118.1 hypothetical protein [Xanthomonas hortorum pv. vitians]
MDHFEGVVLDYLRADRALFVNSQCCIQLNEGANPDTSGPCWHCDAVVVSFKEQAACLCEIDVHPILSSASVWSPIPYPEEIGREETFY